MEQRTLFDAPPVVPPVARDSDPVSSHEAAERVTTGGQRAANMEAVFALVLASPGSTSVELWTAAGGRLERHEVSRRLSDLRAAGRVRQGEVRACGVRGTRMVTWWEVRP